MLGRQHCMKPWQWNCCMLSNNLKCPHDTSGFFYLFPHVSPMFVGINSVLIAMFCTQLEMDERPFWMLIYSFNRYINTLGIFPFLSHTIEVYKEKHPWILSFSLSGDASSFMEGGIRLALKRSTLSESSPCNPRYLLPTKWHLQIAKVFWMMFSPRSGRRLRTSVAWQILAGALE